MVVPTKSPRRLGNSPLAAQVEAMGRVAVANRRLVSGSVYGNQSIIDTGLGPGMYDGSPPPWNRIVVVRPTVNGAGLYDMGLYWANGLLGWTAVASAWGLNFITSNPTLTVADPFYGVYLQDYDYSGDIRGVYLFCGGPSANLTRVQSFDPTTCAVVDKVDHYEGGIYVGTTDS